MTESLGDREFCTRDIDIANHSTHDIYVSVQVKKRYGNDREFIIRPGGNEIWSRLCFYDHNVTIADDKKVHLKTFKLRRGASNVKYEWDGTTLKKR